MGCGPCSSLTPAASHVKDCYPPPKQLAQSGPDFKPLSQDLSKLVYFALNKPSQLAKIGEELEKRVQKEARASSGGYAKSRATLLISLAIVKSLVTECKRDLPLFARSVVKIINLALDVKVYQKGGMDLEVVGRAAGCFTAFATYTDGSAVGTDDGLTRDYFAVLGKFARMAVSTGGGAGSRANMSEKTDPEEQSRIRLIGLAALSGASGSDALFSSNSEFSKQAQVIVPPLLANLFEANMDQLKLEAAKIEMDASPSPFFSEFSARRPINDRRAPSLHAHIPGEKGPSGNDVFSAALRSLHALVEQCQANQLANVLDVVLAFCDERGWTDVERCCWLAERMTAYTSLQYRFVVPTRLIESLVAMADGTANTKHTTLLAMVTTLLNSNVSLVGLGVSDLLNNLISLLVRRIRFDPRDALLPPLVQCVSSLGTHIYYADQINDVVEEIAQRMAEVSTTDKSRPEILRVLIYCIIGTMTTARSADEAEVRRAPPPMSPSISAKGKAPQIDTPVEAPRSLTNRRNPISAQVWQETLPLLCESTYAVRAAYTRALILFLQNEMPRDAGPVRPGDLTAYRFSNALHAAVYTLAMSSCLGSDTSPEPSLASAATSPRVKQTEMAPSVTDSRSEIKQEKGVSFSVEAGGTAGTAAAPLGSATPHRSIGSRRVSLPLNRVNSSAPLISFDNVATPFDFAAIIHILDALHEAVPVAALATGLPMLLALDSDAGAELVRRSGDGRSGAWVLERKRAVRETVAIVWKRIARKWEVSSVAELAEKALAALPEPFVVPNLPPPPPAEALPLPDEPEPFQQHLEEGESSITAQPLLNAEVIVSSFANSASVQRSSARDAAALNRRFATRWTVENAIKDSVERFSAAQIPLAEGNTHFDIANVLLMQSDNGSYQSVGRQAVAGPPRPVDVQDLRLALGQGGGASGTGTAPASIASTTRTGTAHGHASGSAPIPIPGDQNGSVHSNGYAAGSASGHRRTQSPDVKEVLKDIFKEKKRAGGRKSGAMDNGVAQTNAVAQA